MRNNRHFKILYVIFCFIFVQLIGIMLFVGGWKYADHNGWKVAIIVTAVVQFLISAAFTAEKINDVRTR